MITAQRIDRAGDATALGADLKLSHELKHEADRNFASSLRACNSKGYAAPTRWRADELQVNDSPMENDNVMVGNDEIVVDKVDYKLGFLILQFLFQTACQQSQLDEGITSLGHDGERNFTPSSINR